MKVKFFIEKSQTAPFQVEWKNKVENLDFIPFPGMIIKVNGDLVYASNLVYDLDNNIVEVYTKQGIQPDTKDPAVN